MSTTDAMVSPIVSGSIQLASGLVEYPTSYISRNFAVGGTALSVYLEIYQPSASTIKVYYYNGTSYVEIARNVSKATSLSDGFVDMAFEVTGLALATTKIKIVMDTTDNTQRPKARNLRAFIV
jgi:spermidine/putrescine-binding protein